MIRCHVCRVAVPDRIYRKHALKHQAEAAAERRATKEKRT